MIDLKSILVILSLVIGALLIIGPYISNIVETAKTQSKTPDSVKPAPIPVSDGESVVPIRCLEALIHTIDDKETADYLIDKVVPQLVRKSLK